MNVFVVITCIYAAIWAVVGIACYVLFRRASADPNPRDLPVPDWVAAALLGMMWPLLLVQFSWLVCVAYSGCRKCRPCDSESKI